ncbi:MAG: InlB B-repeat-containing protein, partial [Lachnospiraceae bacterium]|nr:InlB B-repeat-containing protein [Lachnospiraceae bacterium]
MKLIAANLYSVTYNKNSGTIAGESNYTSYIEGVGLTLPTPTRTSYTFGGWYTSSSFSGSAVTAITTTDTGNKTYYAKWTANTYTVTYNKNSGTIASESSYTSYTYGTGLTLPKPTRTGYTFGGWYTSSSFSGNAVTSITTTATGDKIYYAKWTDDTAPVIGTLRYSYQPASLWQWLIGKKDLAITVPVTEEGSGATEITYTETPEGGQASQKRSTITNGEASITFDADFRGTIVITCTDQANNTSKSVTVGMGSGATGIIIEDHAPEIACKADKEEISTEKYYNAPDITVTVTDDRNSVISGGIASVSWQIGDHTETLKRDFTASMITSAVFTIPAADIPAGETEITITAIDNAGNKTVLVQKISVMTVAEKVAIAKQAVEKALAGITAANDTTKDDIQSVMDTALTNAGISSNDVTVTVGELSKTKATTDAAGSIGGRISIVSKAAAEV